MRRKGTGNEDTPTSCNGLGGSLSFDDRVLERADNDRLATDCAARDYRPDSIGADRQYAPSADA